MTTIRIDNGDIAIDEDTGIPFTVSGIEEGAQSVARHILSEFDSFFDEGNELLTYALGATTAAFTETLVDQFLTEAINRLIIKQRDAELDDRIVKVNQVKTRVVGLSTLVFLVEALFESGNTVTVIDQTSIKPVKLDHIADPSAFIEV